MSVVMVTGLFGERPADRAGRLRSLLGEEGIITGFYPFSMLSDILLFIPALSGVEKQELKPPSKSSGPKTKAESVWYHEGPPELLAARYAIANYSITRWVWST